MLVFIFVLLLLVWIYLRTRKPPNFPPGPPRLPVVGSLPFMGGSGEKPSLLYGIGDQMKKHGKIFGFYFSSTPNVVITDYNLIKEALKMEQLTPRPDFRPNNEIRPGWNLMKPDNFGRLPVPGVIFSHGPYWRELRRFLLRNLRDFGFGKSSMEDQFLEEVAKLNRKLGKNVGQPIDLNCLMNVSIVNALWSIIVGDNFDLEDPNLVKVVNSVDRLVRGFSAISPLSAILPHPSIVKLPILRDITKFSLGKSVVNEISSIIMPYIEAHQQSLDPENVRDFLDVMLIEAKNNSEPDSCFSPNLGIFTIINSMIDLFLAGMETTSSSLIFVFLHLLHHPNVQQKVHKEIDMVIGKNRFPSLEDKNNMPYVSAVLLESLRSASLVFISVPHSTHEEVKLGGFTIPKGTNIMPSIFHVHHDPDHFKEPDLFNPDRFINAEGKFVNDERVMPFGVGKRVCLGQTLAEKEFFIFFIGILQQFEILPLPGTVLPSYVDIYPEAMIRTPPKLQVIFKKRF